MAFLKVKNRAVSSLASGVDDVATSWTLATGEGSKFPSSGDFHVTCEDEIVKCTSRSGDVLTVTRAQEGTSAAAHASGKAVQLRITAGVIDAIEGETIKQSLLTTRGDIIYRGASVAERLAKGTEGYILRQGANDPEWALIEKPLMLGATPFYIKNWMNEDGFTKGGDAGGSFTTGWTKGSLVTHTDLNDKYYIHSTETLYVAMSAQRFYWEMSVGPRQTDASEIFIGWTDAPTVIDLDNDKHFGFFLDSSNDWYASSGDGGGAATQTDTGVNNTGTGNTYLAVLQDTDYIYYYINGNIVASHEIGVDSTPPNGSEYFTIHATTKSNGDDITIWVKPLKLFVFV